MRKEIIYCDKCGKEIDFVVEAMHLDFCEDCYANLCDVVQNWIDESEPLEDVAEPDEEEEVIEEPDTKVAAPAKKAIDWDKACALKKAGWANKAIAEECNIKLSTLNVEIYKKVKQYDERKANEEALAKKKIVEV